MNRFGHGQAPRQYGQWWPHKNETQFLRAQVEKLQNERQELMGALLNALKAVVDCGSIREAERIAIDAIAKAEKQP